MASIISFKIFLSMPRGLNLKGFYSAFLNFSSNQACYIKENINDKNDIFVKMLPFDEEKYKYLIKTALNSSSNPPKIRMTDVSLAHVEIIYINGEKEIKYVKDERFWEVVDDYLKMEEI